ncbi:hypothetical protein DL93DRAFT_805693 [Clavulina sp. PMI_390]|nr:hypothetical protein DL93DRAFT_805693 [Clavulina sp. PMI_390]
MTEITIDVNLSDEDGNTPLHVVVAKYGSMDTVQALLNAGADPNKCNDKGDGPLDIVVNKIAEYQDATPESWQSDVLERYREKRTLLERYGARLHSQERKEG